MGVTRRQLTWTLGLGLAAVFLGERVLQGFGLARLLFSGGGAMAVVAVTVRSALAWSRGEGDARHVHGIFTAAYLGCAIALVLGLVGTVDGMRLLRIEFDDPLTDLRFRHGFLSASALLMVISLLPALAAQWAERRGGAAGAAKLGVEARRVQEVAASALSVALAGGFLMLGGYIGAARDATVDVSYFKTSRPGSAVREITAAMEQPVRALLFFPDIHPVKDEVLGYFRDLEGSSDNVVVEEYDRLAVPEIAARYDVTQDATVVLLTEGGSEEISLSTDLDMARVRLRVFDSIVQEALLKLTRERRVVYLTTGHGERNDPVTRDAPEAEPGDPPALPLDALRELMGFLNYEVRDLGVRTGLTDRIPDDAAALMIIGPEREFLIEEMDAVESYLARGGSLLLALEPGSAFTMDRLRDELGVEFRSANLVDDQQHMRQRGGLADRRLLVTDRLSSHPSVVTAGRRGVGSGILVPSPGYLVPAEDVDGPDVSFTIVSLPSSFVDLNGNFELDRDTEVRRSVELAAAVEGPVRAGGAPMRALVFADADMFSDDVLVSLALNTAVVADGVRWLGREEAFAGDVVSEEDAPIQHTRAENVAWFYAIILGAPLLVLVAGGVTQWSRRGRRRVSA